MAYVHPLPENVAKEMKSLLKAFITQTAPIPLKTLLTTMFVSGVKRSSIQDGNGRVSTADHAKECLAYDAVPSIGPMRYEVFLLSRLWVIADVYLLDNAIHGL